MKKLFAKAFLGLCALGTSTVAFAQDAADAATAVEGGMYQALKTKFIEGGADFMSLVAIALIFGLAFCLERIIYLNLAETNSSKLLKGIEDALDKGDVEGAKAIARDTRGPIASIAYQGLMRIDQGIDVVEKSIVSYGGVQGGLLEKNMSWITLFIAMARTPHVQNYNARYGIIDLLCKYGIVYGLTDACRRIDQYHAERMAFRHETFTKFRLQ